MPFHIPYTFGVTLFAAIGTFLFGYDSGIATTIIAFPSWNTYMSHPSPTLIGGISSAYSAGEALGVLLQTLIADRLGRIRFLQLLCVITLLGTCVQTASTGIRMFIAGRAVTGFGVGGMVATIPLYLSEIAPPRRRGFLAGFTGVGIAVGVMMSSWVAVACFYAPQGDVQWRVPIALQIPWTPVLFLGLATFMPESPRILLRKGRLAEAERAFERVHRGEGEGETRREFALMRAQIEYEKGREFVGYLALFRQYRQRVLVAIAIALMAILSGAPVVGFYQTILYRALGIQQKNILILAAARGTLSLVAVLLINRFLLDQWGRRQLLLWGMAISTGILIYCAAMQKIYQDSDNQVGKGFAVLGIFAHAFFNDHLCGTLESVCPIYNAEILPIALRSKVIGIAAFIFFSVTVAFTEAAPSAFANIKQNYYYVFVGCTAVMWVIGYYWFPETTGRTLEEIAAAFGDRVVDVARENSETNMVLVEETKGADVRVNDREAGMAV
ncbi:hypothetical protein M409DRAFT_65513 [Zasmidium cellare ATCC 36951]|uniref:Major facilitator superfamily (MFS) profile domain-containing protein n=1 Tax=Zasmidium cellare ATCC 36951 TaxID=1080233 RepID=A0A6A6CMX7_ZASCE|nr:uncharacterized protein M409DRAFT_65513 [Zasmidium cellare ATCC 36951]KAF2168607.1 hypothetical protein M409DRAFT_65513 [Zasmidium cellare ATCC 36951]